MSLFDLQWWSASAAHNVLSVLAWPMDRLRGRIVEWKVNRLFGADQASSGPPTGPTRADDDLLKDVAREARNWTDWRETMRQIIDGEWS